MKQSDRSIRTHLHNRQLILFLTAVLLPSLVLIVLTWHVMGQQKELSAKRQADERKRVAGEIGQKLLARLEDIKLHEVSGAAGGTKSLNTRHYSSPEEVLVALADGKRLWLPWETDPRVNRMIPVQGDSEMAQKLRRAEQEEYIHQRWAQSNKLYLECIEETEYPDQKAYIRLLRARLLAKSGDRDNSLAEYRRVLESDPAMTDEHGIPLCLYATSSLAERRDSIDGIVDVIESRLDTAEWFSPAEAYMIRDVVSRLMESGPEMASQRETVEELQQRVLERIDKQEMAVALQQDFPRLTLLPQWNSSQARPEAIWIPYGDQALLIGLAPALPDERRLLIAVHGQDILETIIAETPYAKARLVGVTADMAPDLDGQTLGPAFPGLSIVFPDELGGSAWEDGKLQRSFYLVALFVVLCVALFGAYFLWRDVTREMHLAEMRSQFIASVSHELKTPLTAIRVFAETLQLGRSKDSQTQSEYLDTIVNESHRLTRLLNNVLDFSKIEKGKRAYHKEPVPPADIIRAAAEAMQYPIMQRDFRLKVAVEDHLPDICVDRDAIEQAILNLLSNAMKYSGRSREIELNAYKKDKDVVMEVKDQGMGIEAAEQLRIFERFYRVTSQENERIPGTGLGLALVAHIIEGHGGRIEVQSRLGEGSTFSLYLPMEHNYAANSRC